MNELLEIIEAIELIRSKMHEASTIDDQHDASKRLLALYQLLTSEVTRYARQKNVMTPTRLVCMNELVTEKKVG